MVTTSFLNFQKPTFIVPERATVTIPAFELDASTWTGASIRLATLSLEDLAVIFSLKRPIEVFGGAFTVAVSWVDAEGDIQRRVLWEHEDAVLNYDVYNGEAILVEDAQLEIWSVDTEDAPTLEEDEVLDTSILDQPNFTGVPMVSVTNYDLTLVEE